MDNNQLSLNQDMAINLSQLKLYPAPLAEEETKLVEYTKLPLSRVTAMGTAFEPIVSAVQNVMGKGTTGIYKVTIPNGTHLAQLKKEQEILAQCLAIVTIKSQDKQH